MQSIFLELMESFMVLWSQITYLYTRLKWMHIWEFIKQRFPPLKWLPEYTLDKFRMDVTVNLRNLY